MKCFEYKDYDLRVKLVDKGVVHAGTYVIIHAHKVYSPSRGIYEVPEERVVGTACSCKRFSEDQLVGKTQKITCKRCLRALDEADLVKAPKRFVILRKDTGEFFRNTYRACGNWSKGLTDAFFFKRFQTAKSSCMKTKIILDGKEITYEKWCKTGYPHVTYAKVRDTNLEVHEVKIELDTCAL